MMLKLVGKTQGAVISCNVSYKDRIDAPTLVGLLSGKISLSPEWLPHLDTFFNELPNDDIEGVMKENNLTVGALAAVFFSLPPVLQSRHFKELLRDFEQ